MDQAVSDFHVREQQVMQTLFKTCAFSNIHKQPFYMYEHNIVLLLSEGVDVGVIQLKDPRRPNQRKNWPRWAIPGVI